MREIKFRAWDKIKQRWCLCEELTWCISSNPFASGGGIFELDESNREQDSAWNIGTSYDLMQFTGLLDKNGKEIYEGDILKTKHDGIQKVYWDNDLMGFYPFSKPAFGGYEWENCIVGENNECIEVIGNIYENPELIEEAIEKERP